MWEIMGSLVLILAIAGFAVWYQHQPDEEDDVQLQERDRGLEEYTENIFAELRAAKREAPQQQSEQDIYESYRAKLVNSTRGTSKE